MLTHYLKIAFRTIGKYKTQSLTGIFGLAFAIACFVPALYWLRYETSYDSFYPDSADIYRIYSFDKQSGKVNDLVSGVLDRDLQEQLPAIKASTVFFVEQNDCRTEELQHVRLNMIFTDSTFLHVFPQGVVGGEVRQPLQTMNNLILTESVAVRLFGDVEKAVGQQIQSTMLVNDPPYTVTAVVKDPPANTNVPFDAILSYAEIQQQKTYVDRSGRAVWSLATLFMYARIHPETDMRHLAGQLRDFPSTTYANANMEIGMMPVGDVRHKLNTDVPFTLNFIRLFVVAGILLLLSALFNFLNLHLNLLRQRSRELHQRTIFGAKSRQLIRQMFFELFCWILLSIALAGVIVVLVYPLFSGLLNLSLGMSHVVGLFLVCGLGLILLLLLVSVIPFRRLSRLAESALSVQQSAGQPVLRRVAVVLQLAVSIVFIVAALVVMMQMRFVNHKDLGFDRDGIVYLSGMNLFMDRNVSASLRSELAATPQVESVTDTYFTPQHSLSTSLMSTLVEWPGKKSTEKLAFQLIATDSRFDETFRIKMQQGAWIEEGGAHTVVLNEEAVRVMELPEPVIGTMIRLTPNNEQEYRVVGVVKDFHTLSLRSRIQPAIFYLFGYPSNNFYVRVLPGQEQAAIQRINEILPTIDPVLVSVHPTPLNDLYDRLNYSEQAGLQLFTILAVVCLLISLVGIYAVATASTRRRRKEIAIRKVMGAEARDIVRIFFNEYILQVIIAGAVALPLAYIAMSRWLQGYAYRTSIPWWLSAGVMVGVIAVVLLTVLGQVLKAAQSNPAEVVKSE